MTLQRLTRISLLAALCVALRQAFAPFPNVQPISAIFFLLVMFEGYSFAFLVMMITMFVSAFFLELDCVLSDCCLWLFDAHLAHQLQVVALCPSDPFCGPTVLCLWGLDR